jgi:hypothetical protein
MAAEVQGGRETDAGAGAGDQGDGHAGLLRARPPPAPGEKEGQSRRGHQTTTRSWSARG